MDWETLTILVEKSTSSSETLKLVGRDVLYQVFTIQTEVLIHSRRGVLGERKMMEDDGNVISTPRDVWRRSLNFIVVQSLLCLVDVDYPYSGNFYVKQGLFKSIT